MENSWQSKCGSPWQQPHPPPPLPLVASSTVDSRTKLPQEPVLLTGGTIQEHMFRNMHGLGNLGQDDIRASFLSLVSSPSEYVPCNQQHSSDPKLVSDSNLISPNHRTSNGFSVGSTRASTLPGPLWPHSMDVPNLTSRELFSPLISSNANVNTSNSSPVLQAANLNYEKSQAVFLKTHEKDRVKSLSSLIGNNTTNPVCSDSWNLQKYAHITALQKVPVESDLSAYRHAYIPSSSLPRVSCSGISGNLLLSDTGLIGVVCFCHGLYMSISKFTEHSGSSDVNPGNAVRMENGETVAHWWRTFFSETGTRVREGHKGWDWPEGISAASGLTDLPISSMSNNPVLLNQVGPFRAPISYQQQKSMINSKENRSCRNTVDEYLYPERDKTSQESSNSFFKYFMNSSYGNLQLAAVQHTHGLPNSFGAHKERASQCTTGKLDSICESANSLPDLPKIQDVKEPCNVCSVGKKTTFIVERPGVSSNVELRLGQPSEQSLREFKVQPLFGSDPIGVHEPLKVFFSDKLLQKSNESKSTGWTLQGADIASNPTETRRSTQLEHSSNVHGACGAVTSNVSLEMTNVNSPLLSCVKHPDTKWQFKNIYGNSANDKLHYESHASNSKKICLQLRSVAGTTKEFGTHMSNAQINVNKGKEVECAVNGLLGAPKSNIEFSKAFKEDMSSFYSVLDESKYNCSPAFHEKTLNSDKISAMIVDESYGRDILNKISSLSDITHFNHDRGKPIQDSIVSMPMSFSSKNSVCVGSATPILSMEKFSGIKKGLQHENLGMLAVWDMLALSNRDKCPASVASGQECQIKENQCSQSLLTTAPSKDHTYLLDSLKTPKVPEIGEKSRLLGTICRMAHNSERFGMVTGRSLFTEGPNLPHVEQLFVRGNEYNFTHSKKEQYSQGLPYAYIPEKCSSAAQENCLVGNYELNGDDCCNLVKEGDKSAAATSLLHRKFNENCIFLKETPKSFKKPESLAPNDKSAESCYFQWRDVPKKVTESCSLTGKKQQACSYIPSSRSPTTDVAKCFAGFAQTVVPLKEHEISNISSRCSAPDVTHSSVEVSKKDSSTVEGGNIRSSNNLVMDRGSENDGSCSSDYTFDNDFCAEFFESASKVNLVKRESFKIVPKKRSLSLIEEIRLQNSLWSKYSPYKTKRSSTIQEETDHLKKSELGPKKRRKTVKWMKLDVPAPGSGRSSITNGSPKCTKEVGHNAYSFGEMQMPVACDQGSLSNRAVSVEKGVKQTGFAFSASKGISRRKDLLKPYHQGAWQTAEAHQSSVVDDTLKASEIFRKKTSRLDDSSAMFKEIREIGCNSAELTEKLTSFCGHSNSLGEPKFYRWKVRPTVFGKYGIICNGNPSKPAKIIPLKNILKAAVFDSEKSNWNADEDEKLKPPLKAKKASGRHVKETALNKKVPRSRVKKGGTHNFKPIGLESCDWNGEIESISCSANNGNDDMPHTLRKCNNYSTTDSKPAVQLKTKSKEGRKRSLHELLIEGNCFKVVNSSVMKDSSSLCQTTSRCCGELMATSVDCQACNPEGLGNNAEAGNEEDVSFNGRCMPHSAIRMFIPDSDSESLQPGEKFLTCARTEGYKGRKREGFLHNHPQDTNGNGGCLVPREQLNAWMHIHRQKPQRKGHRKFSSPHVESDCRKAYTRYKQSKSWKHLVVYKSDIHALGLYTSQFISRGAMVVEYVGEIVGLRVADRRESEYHSGKKLQHKSACYFFRIDKEHIIDATRKGGIARFVNHSCQPNCVAKVISVRTEKKVVFFAERDIYPGEEITYDYHFNHEDEGERIPCYCNSKNCRRYLN